MVTVPLLTGRQAVRTEKHLKGWPRPVMRVVLVMFASGVGLAYFFGWRLLAPVPRVIGPPAGEFSAETVSFPSDSGTMIVGWLSEPPRVRGAVLLLHPVRGDRRSMVGQAEFLVARGYTTLSIDFQAHGESPGEQITMGHLEALDAAAGVAYLRDRYPGMPVAVIGRSLGGAAHVNFHGYARVEYGDRILHFLEQNLRAARLIAQ
mgnify:CR=1 FL=1